MWYSSAGPFEFTAKQMIGLFAYWYTLPGYNGDIAVFEMIKQYMHQQKQA
jgi:hypothetical protein